MSDDDKIIPFINPNARAGRPTPPPPPPPSRLDQPSLPTRLRYDFRGRPFIENPNECALCHKGRHVPTPHHSFEPAEASILIARRLGWDIPQEMKP